MLARRGQRWQPLAATLIGNSAATIVARESGREDPGFVVVDEVVGQWIALIAVRPDWRHAVAGARWLSPPVRYVEAVADPEARRLLPEGNRHHAGRCWPRERWRWCGAGAGAVGLAALEPHLI